jgi:predicted amidohydrolase
MVMVDRGRIARQALLVIAAMLALLTLGASLDFGGSTPDATANEAIVLGVLQLEVGRDKADNLAEIAARVAEAAAVGVDLLVLPELATTQYPWGITEAVTDYLRDGAEAVPGGATFAAMSDLAATYGISLCWGMLEASDSAAPYNSMVLVGADGALLGVYRKLHLVPGVEQAVFSAGETLSVVDTPFGPVGMLICYDRRFPELARTYALLGARLLLVGAATTDEAVDEHILATRAYENGTWLLFANQVGPSASGAARPFHGGSRIIDPRGQTRAQAQTEGAELIWTRIDPSELGGPSALLDRRRTDAYAASGALLWADREEAESTVLRELFPGGTAGHSLYILPERLDAGSQILDWNAVVHEVTAPSWFVFIDDAPEANWEHPCRYVFVDAVTRALTVLDHRLPPRRLDEMDSF